VRSCEALLASESLATAVTYGAEASAAPGAAPRAFTIDGEELSVALQQG